MNDEIMNLEEAAEFMRLGQRVVRDWISSGQLVAIKSKGRGGKFLILKSDCIASIKARQHNSRASATDGYSTEVSWPSNLEAQPGTVISLHRTASELGSRLAQRTKGRHKSSTTN